jgi:peptidoglycan/LPS O-acetylase OafA/YrhL
MPFLANRDSGNLGERMSGYVIKRLARILPAYYLCLFALIAIDWALKSPPDVENVLTHLLFLFNLNDRHILSINQPFWTLAVEMQFYLLLPLVILATRRHATPAIFWSLVLLAFGCYLANLGLMNVLLARDQWPISFTMLGLVSVYISRAESFVLTYSTLAHLTLFFSGVAISVLYVAWTRGGRPKRVINNRAAEIIFWTCAVAVFVILSTPLEEHLQVPFGRYNWPYVPLLLAALLLATPSTRIARSLLEWAPLRYVGLISYGVYIFHYPIQHALARLLAEAGLGVDDHWVIFGVGSLSATIGVASASYYLIERPVMRWARGCQPSRPPAATAPASRQVEQFSGPEQRRPDSSDPGGSRWIQIRVRLRNHTG